MRKWWFSILLFSSAYANLEPYLRTYSEKPFLHQIPHIDAIYLINLNERPEKWERSYLELRPYGIQPCRFSAINGWSLSLKTLQEIGVKFQKGMRSGLWAFTPDLTGLKYDFLKKDVFNKTYFACWSSLGALGCTLSHLSVLKQAYNAGYETIWVMEDDIQVVKDPNKLAYLIEDLNEIDPDWDVLYTDLDSDASPALYSEQTDFETDLKGELWFFWRPDFPDFDKNRLAKREVKSKDFLKIGSRLRTHSMVIRRSGMEKILNFENKHHTFVPYDHEIALVPGIRLYSLRYPLVTFLESHSDTKNRLLNSFDQLFQKLVSQSPCPEKLQALLPLLCRLQPEVCVEVGAKEGSISYPMASVFQLLSKGHLHAIDAWEKTDPKIELSYQRLLYQLLQSDLENWCHLVRKKPLEAACEFRDEIDFLYFNGNLEELISYLPKVKSGGYIWLDDSHFLEKMSVLDYLMERCEWDQAYLKGIDASLFKKL